MGGVGGKHTGVSTQWGHRLHRLVRPNLFHVATATVAARGLSMEVTETLISFRLRQQYHIAVSSRTHAGRGKQPVMSVGMVVRRHFRPNENKISDGYRERAPIELEVY